MQLFKSKCAAIAIALFLTLSMTTSMMLVPTAKASTSSNIPTYAYINVAPNPTGVNQQVEVIMWVNWVFGAGPGNVGGAELTNNYRFHNYELTITAPNSTTYSKTFATVSDPTSDLDYYFTPTAVGTWIFTFNFPETTINSTNDPISPYLGDTYVATSASTNLTVQSASIPAIPSTPLPTTYWTRPIYGENSNWYTISSNWLGGMSYGVSSPGYSGIGNSPNLGANEEQFPTQDVGPMTAHIMWTKPLQSGGVVGGNNFVIQGDTYFEGSAYEQRFDNPIILDGMLYYTEPISTTEPSSGPTVCVNLQTGQQIWSSTSVPALGFGYIYDAQDPNEHGVWPPMLVAPEFSYVTFTTTWEVFDADTGDSLFNVSNVPSGVTLLGPEGEYLVLSLVNYGPVNAYGVPTGPAQWYLQEWNSSRLWDDLYSGPSTTPDLPPPISNGQIACNAQGVPNGQPVTATWTGGYILYEGEPTYVPSMYDFNVSVPALNGQPTVTEVGAILGDMMLCYSGNLPSEGANIFFGPPSETPYTYYGINLNAAVGTMGEKLWSNTLQPPSGNITVIEAGIDPVNNVFVEEYRETMQFVGYSLLTGGKLWGPTAEQASLDYYGSPGSGSLADAIDYGRIYSSAYAGILYCYDTKTGDLLWTYGNGGAGNSTNSGVESPFGYYPTFVNAIGNGVVYLVTTEHTIETPIFKGALVRAVNATTGAQIWTLSDYTGEFLSDSFAMADGYATFFNGYDNQIYCVGRGPSQTTANAGPQVTTLGDNVVISGTVTDIATGTKQTEQAGDFPNGVPCAADSIMTQWMGYVYQQQPEPTNFVGVPVTIRVTDSNHNTYPIGTVTTNEQGFYTLTWSPIITGNYTVTATFAGTNAYYPSSDVTSFNVMSAPPTASPAPSPPTGLASTGTVELGVVAIIIVIVIIGALILVLLSRKRP